MLNHIEVEEEIAMEEEEVEEAPQTIHQGGVSLTVKPILFRILDIFHRIPNHKGHNSRSVESLDICPLINFTEWIITIKDAILLPN